MLLFWVSVGQGSEIGVVVKWDMGTFASSIHVGRWEPAPEDPLGTQSLKRLRSCNTLGIEHLSNGFNRRPSFKALPIRVVHTMSVWIIMYLVYLDPDAPLYQLTYSCLKTTTITILFQVLQGPRHSILQI